MTIEIDMWWVGFAMVAVVVVPIVGTIMISMAKEDGVCKALMYPLVLILIVAICVAVVIGTLAKGIGLMVNNPPPWAQPVEVKNEK